MALQGSSICICKLGTYFNMQRFLSQVSCVQIYFEWGELSKQARSGVCCAAIVAPWCQLRYTSIWYLLWATTQWSEWAKVAVCVAVSVILDYIYIYLYLTIYQAYLESKIRAKDKNLLPWKLFFGCVPWFRPYSLVYFDLLTVSAWSWPDSCTSWSPTVTECTH